jgi:hypothetical protein
MPKAKAKIFKYLTGLHTAGNYFRVYEYGGQYYFEPVDEEFSAPDHYSCPYKTEAKAITAAQHFENEYR